VYEKQIRLVSNFTLKEAEEGSEELTIEGYANTIKKDRVGDIVLREAWEKGGLDNFEKNPILLAFHNHSRPIGKVSKSTVNNKGLKITATISKAAGDVYDLVKEGILTTFSIGFQLKDGEWDRDKDIFYIKDLELMEISVVSVPANADSTFSVKKSVEDNGEDYEEFKKQFTNKEAEGKNVSTKASENNEEILAKLAELAEQNVELTNQLKEISTKANKPEVTPAPEGTKMTIEVKKEGTEALLETIEARFAAIEASRTLDEEGKQAEIADLMKTVEDLRGEITDKSEEIEAFRKSKMLWEGDGNKIELEDKINAALLAKCLGRQTQDTKSGKELIEKSGGEHIPATADDDGGDLLWEQELSTSLLADYRNRLIVADALSGDGTRLIQMPTPVFRMPVNPEAGAGQWIPVGNYRSTAGPLSGSPSSTGSNVDHAITDITLIAHKLAAKEFIGYEEEEDSIIPLLPIIREAVARRMARSWDIALLRGTATETALLATHDPISGLVNLAGSPATAGNVGSITKMTVATLQTMRKGLGARGLNPNDVVYIVSYDAYYDLLEDPDFRTPDVIGSENATILKGTLGMVNGSQVIASGEFSTKATTVCNSVCVYRQNFMIGELRGMMLERDKSVEDQTNMLIATRRAAFGQIIANEGVTGGYWV